MLNFGLNRNSWNKSKAKNKNNYASLALVSLEQRVNPAPTVSISFNTNTGVLLLQSNALLNESSSYESFQSTGTLNQQKILNFSASPGFATTFNSIAPLVFVDPLTTNSSFVQVDTRNLAGFTKIIFSGSQGNDTFVLGSMDGNVLGSNSSVDFGFEIDVQSTQGGFSTGVDSLQVNGAIALKGAGAFTTDSVNSTIPNLNLEVLNFGTSGSISSIGSGQVRLVADGFQSSNILMKMLFAPV